jgi:oxygen-independent coproporphyrinogen-3 oxidase
VKEIDLYQDEQILVTSIFIGGGTPSLLNVEQITKLMLALKTFGWAKEIEITIESNPGTLTLEKLQAYKKHGINRISMGVQTGSDDELVKLERIHNFETVKESIALIKEAGILNYNLDLMFGLPGQTLSSLDKSIDAFVDLEPTHISAYSLKYEEGTKFYQALEAGEQTEVDEELDRDMYHLIINKLEDKGYHQYEISNFAKDTFECQHNLVYWGKKPYLAFGLGSHGYDIDRYHNVSDLPTYYKLIGDCLKPIEAVETLDFDEDWFEYMMLGLRLNKGFSLKKFSEKYGFDFEKKFNIIIKSLIEDDLMILEGDYIKLSRKGLDLSNQVFIKFL